jgi:hypothetical protein
LPIDPCLRLAAEERGTPQDFLTLLLRNWRSK